jgi:hypothetical protein
MKKAQLSALLKQIQPELYGFKVKGQLLSIDPISHTLRGVWLDQSMDPRAFYVQVFVQPLFIPAEEFHFDFGWRIGARSWNADTPNLVRELGMAIKAEAVPFLTKISTPMDVAEAAMALRKRGNPNIQRAIAYSFARAGETQKAIAVLDDFLRRMPAKITTDWFLEDARRAEILRDELERDPVAAQRRLLAWEARTKQNLRLE